MGEWLTCTNTGYRAEFDCCWSSCTSVKFGDPLEKPGPFAFRFSLSLNVIETDTDRSDTYDFLLTDIYSNLVP